MAWTDLVAIYAAVLSTLNVLWEMYMYRKQRCDLSVSKRLAHLYSDGERTDRVWWIDIDNNASVPNTVRRVDFVGSFKAGHTASGSVRDKRFPILLGPGETVALRLSSGLDTVDFRSVSGSKDQEFYEALRQSTPDKLIGEPEILIIQSQSRKPKRFKLGLDFCEPLSQASIGSEKR